MPYGRRQLGNILRHWAKLSIPGSRVAPYRLFSTTPLTVSSSAASSPVDLSYTCHLLDSIRGEQQADTVKRKRVRGAVRKMEATLVDSFAAATMSLTPQQRLDLMVHWLRSLAAVAKYLSRREDSPCTPESVEVDRFSPRSSKRVRHETREGETWSGASPFFSLPTSDLLCACLRECAMANPRAGPDALRELLLCAVKLELGEVEVLQHIVHALTREDVCRLQTPSEQVELLNYVSLAVKRCKLPLPPLNRVLSALLGATLSARENLLVLSSIHRLKHTHATDVVAVVSRRAAKQTGTYNFKDVVYGLEVAALLPGCTDVFVASVLLRAGALAPLMSPRQLGAVCKYVALLNTSRRKNAVAYSCGRELRSLVPLLVERAERLLGQFRLHEARYVLRCFREHNVRHSLIFSRLTPIAADG
ncbi:hypothetical protein LSCM1_02435 [Leishmania martiniquensis]|uniref:Mitochondrial RNA binding protein n=1 Tax=Leishmania martiniquensis TaxID=1580590 RepID=A0A836KF27_9TRYP|nr:hypothetical protein LSCM1_02435 [Leishmania martiniquensis]